MDVKDLTFDTLRTRVAVVLQETVLFSGTIRENIAFGAPNASKTELERAAEAHALMESSQHIGKIILEVVSGGSNA